MMDTDAARRMMRYDANKRSLAMAYLLLAATGLLGGHRFYLGRGGSALIMLLLTLASLPWALIFWGWPGMFVTIIWVVIDALRLPGMVQQANNKLIASLA
jgi:TM2 domain-containing membrane protein YozV